MARAGPRKKGLAKGPGANLARRKSMLERVGLVPKTEVARRERKHSVTLQGKGLVPAVEEGEPPGGQGRAGQGRAVRRVVNYRSGGEGEGEGESEGRRAQGVRRRQRRRRS